jgi:hypothetical protein
MGARAVPGPRFAPWHTGRGDGGAARKRRGLAIHGAARGVEFVFQLLVFTAQPLPLGFRAPEILTQPIDLARLLVDDSLRVRRRWFRGTVRDAGVMPDRASIDKQKELIASI